MIPCRRVSSTSGASIAIGSTAGQDNLGSQVPSRGANQEPQTPPLGASSAQEDSALPLLLEGHPHRLAAGQVEDLPNTVAAASPPAVALMPEICGSRGFGSKALPRSRGTSIGPLSIDLQPSSIPRHSPKIPWTKPVVASAEPSPEGGGFGDLDDRMDSLLERCQALFASRACSSALGLCPGDQALALTSDSPWDRDDEPLSAQHDKAASMANAGYALRTAAKKGPSRKEAAFHFIEMASLPPDAPCGQSQEAGRRRKRRGRLLAREEEEIEGPSVARPALEALFGLTIQVLHKSKSTPGFLNNKDEHAHVQQSWRVYIFYQKLVSDACTLLKTACSKICLPFARKPRCI